jgi:periplasmic protein TonB
VTSIADLEYTPEARSANIKGTVLLTFLVNTKGQATDIWVLRSLGFGLDQAAASAASKYRFAPASYRQQPVEMQISIEMNFQVF